VAYHEAGHALVAESRAHADRVAKISIIPRGVAALGYTQQQPTEDRYLMTRAELLDRLDVLLGGRTAEEIVLGDISTGAQDDLQRATDLVRHMITRYGMSDVLGLATFEAPRQALFLQVPTGAPREYSEDTARVIDTEIQQFLEAAHTRVRTTLTAKRAVLESLARLLITQEVVDRQALDRLLATPVPEDAAYAPVGECATGEMAARQTKGAAVNVSTHSLVARVLTEPDSEP
jgi:cell division protease FtsH